MVVVNHSGYQVDSDSRAAIGYDVDDTNQDAPEEAEELFDFEALRALAKDEDKERDEQNLRLCFDWFKCTEKLDGREFDGLDYGAFCKFLRSLCTDSDKIPHYIPQYYYVEIFRKFDVDQDGMLDWLEFSNMWPIWLKTVLRPKSALVIVDVQNDFISGSLSIVRCPAGHRGEEVVPVINNLIKTVPFDLVVYSYDWHPDDHISFFENCRNRKMVEYDGQDMTADELEEADIKVLETVTFAGPPRTVQKLWPRHCVQNSWGARLHPELIVPESHRYIDVFKGTNPVIDSYSAFWDNGKLSETVLNSQLRSRGITDIYVCGIAYDVCVSWTAIHGNEYGYRTVLVNDASRGVDVKDISAMKDLLINHSALVVDSDRIPDLVTACDRRPELAYKLAISL
ncbi:Nicotinamidase [Halotydeus destructor]|nr:Nicotinamidase [Halotydeus destructor]